MRMGLCRRARDGCGTGGHGCGTWSWLRDGGHGCGTGGRLRDGGHGWDGGHGCGRGVMAAGRGVWLRDGGHGQDGGVWLRDGGIRSERTGLRIKGLRRRRLPTRLMWRRLPGLSHMGTCSYGHLLIWAPAPYGHLPRRTCATSRAGGGAAPQRMARPPRAGLPSPPPSRCQRRQPRCRPRDGAALPAAISRVLSGSLERREDRGAQLSTRSATSTGTCRLPLEVIAIPGGCPFSRQGRAAPARCGR